MAMHFVSTPSRGAKGVTVSDEEIQEFVDNLPEAKTRKMGIRNDKTFSSMGRATSYGNKIIAGVVQATGDEYLSSNLNDDGERLVKLGLTVRQLTDENNKLVLDENGKPQYTVAVRNWER